MTPSVIAKLKLLEAKQIQCEQGLMRLARRAESFHKRQKRLCAETAKILKGIGAVFGSRAFERASDLQKMIELAELEKRLN